MHLKFHDTTRWMCGWIPGIVYGAMSCRRHLVSSVAGHTVLRWHLLFQYLRHCEWTPRAHRAQNCTGPARTERPTLQQQHATNMHTAYRLNSKSHWNRAQNKTSQSDPMEGLLTWDRVVVLCSTYVINELTMSLNILGGTIWLAPRKKLKPFKMYNCTDNNYQQTQNLHSRSSRNEESPT